MKEVKFKYQTAGADYVRKLDQAKDFLKQGETVKVSCLRYGRQDKAAIISKLQHAIAYLAKVSTASHVQMGGYEGRKLSVTLTPKKVKK